MKKEKGKMALETLEEEELIVLLGKKVIILLKKEAGKSLIDLRKIEVQDFQEEELLIEVLIKDIQEKIIIVNTLEMEEVDLVDMKVDLWEMMEVGVQDFQEVKPLKKVLEEKPKNLVLEEVEAEEHLQEEKLPIEILVWD